MKKKKSRTIDKVEKTVKKGYKRLDVVYSQINTEKPDRFAGDTSRYIFHKPK